MELEHAQHLTQLMLRSSADTDSVVLDENIFGGTDGHLEHIRTGIWNDLENTVYFFEVRFFHIDVEVAEPALDQRVAQPHGARFGPEV